MKHAVMPSGTPGGDPGSGDVVWRSGLVKAMLRAFAEPPRPRWPELFLPVAGDGPAGFAVVRQGPGGAALEVVVAFPTKEEAETFGAEHFGSWTVVPVRFRVFRRTLRPPV